MATQENPQGRPQEQQLQPQPQPQPQLQQHIPKKMDLPTLQSAEIEHARPGPQSPQLEKDAARAMSHTAGWQPSLGGGHRRRESYRQEDLRRELTMGSGGAGVAGGTAAQGMGFTEGRRA